MMRGLKIVMIDRCAGGGDRCWCQSAQTCQFNRCPNCDMPVDRHGNALVTDFLDADRSGPCPYCNGPMPKL